MRSEVDQFDLDHLPTKGTPRLDMQREESDRFHVQNAWRIDRCRRLTEQRGVSWWVGSTVRCVAPVPVAMHNCGNARRVDPRRVDGLVGMHSGRDRTHRIPRVYCRRTASTPTPRLRPPLISTADGHGGVSRGVRRNYGVLCCSRQWGPVGTAPRRLEQRPGLGGIAVVGRARRVGDSRRAISAQTDPSP